MMPLAASPSRAIQSVELPTGVTLQYVEQGSPDGIPTLLLHGMTDSLHSYDPVLPYLPPTIRAFAVTERGHGDSSHPASGYLPGDFAADAAAFLDAFGIEKAVIVGHSMSTSVARRFAVDYPERTLGLVLLGSFASLADNPALIEFAQALEELQDPIEPSFAREFQESTAAQPIPAETMDLFVQESLKVPARVWRDALAGLMGPNHPTLAELEQLRTPTLLIWGDQDAFFPRADQDALLGAIAGSELVVYEGTGHALHWEQPARAAADLAAFAAKLG